MGSLPNKRGEKVVSVSEAMQLSQRKTTGKRQQLLAKQQECLTTLAAIDEALKLMDAHPEVEQLADALTEALRVDY